MIDCPAVIVVDGDTLRCGAERLRLLGIDAPELHGCPRWRVCVAGSGKTAKLGLAYALLFGPVRYQQVSTDRYGRLVVMAWAGRVNLSCWQLERGNAAYVGKWDNGRLVASACRLSA